MKKLLDACLINFFFKSNIVFKNIELPPINFFTKFNCKGNIVLHCAYKT